MTDAEELKKLNDQAELEQLNKSAQAPVNNDEAELAALNGAAPEDKSWYDKFQDNFAAPFMGKLGEMYGAATNMGGDQIRQQALRNMQKSGAITEDEARQAIVTPEEQSRIEPGLGNKLEAGANMFLERAFSSLEVKPGDEVRKIGNKADTEILAGAMAMDKAGQPLQAINAAAMVKGQKFIWNDTNSSKLEKFLNYATVPEQTITRGALGVLADIGAIPRDQAIELMSQTQVHGNDLVDHFWIPETPMGKIGRGLVGFTADVIMDPLSYIGIGPGAALLNTAEKGVFKVGNRVVSDISLLSRLERQALLAKNDVINVIRKTGKVETLSQSEDLVGQVMRAVEDKGMQGLDGSLINKISKVDPELGSQVADIIRARQKVKGTIRSLADQELALNIGFRIPLTKTVVETEVPAFGVGTRWSAQAATGFKDWSFDSAARVVGSMAEASPTVEAAVVKGAALADATSSAIQAFKTFTTRPLWDFSNASYLHAKGRNLNWMQREMSEASKEVGTDPETNDLMVKWLNQEPTLPDEDLINRFGPKGPEFSVKKKTGSFDGVEPGPTSNIPDIEAQYRVDNGIEDRRRLLTGQTEKGLSVVEPNALERANKLAVQEEKVAKAKNQKFEYATFTPTKSTLEKQRMRGDLTEARRLAAETMAQLEMKNPAAAKRVRQIRDQFNARIRVMEDKGIPFNVLNPFDETIPVEERAMGYFPHILNPDYIDELGRGRGYAEAGDLFHDHKVELGLTDKTQAGRADRRSTQTIVDSVKQASGMKNPVFVTDPLSASYQRMQDMDNIISQHDFFEKVFPLAVIQEPKGGAFRAIVESGAKKNDPTMEKLAASFVDEKPGRGYVKMDYRNYSSAVFKRNGGPAVMGDSTISGKMFGTIFSKEEDAQAILQFESFLPREYKQAINNGATIYFPEDVATRMNYVMQREKGGVVRSAQDAYNYLFKNIALSGPGYHGQNIFGNLTTYMSGRADLTEIPQASKFLWDAKNNSAIVRNKTYNLGDYSMNGEELWNTMQEAGVLGNSMAQEAHLSSDIWDNVATTRSQRQKIGDRASTVFDKANFFAFNRHLAEESDNIFRAGMFMDSLKKGYTIDGARERVNLYYYDFKDMAPGQKAIGQLVPFSSFGIKTVESIGQRAMKLDLKPLTYPNYVSQILDGAFVDSYDERKFVRDNVPGWMNDDIIGQGLPGARQVMIQAPFVVGSMGAFSNPLANVHPLVQTLAIAAVAASKGDKQDAPDWEDQKMDSELFRSQWDVLAAKMVQDLLPATVKYPLTMYQMRTPDQVRYLPLDFIAKYKAKTYAEGNNANAGLLTNNAQQFGEYAKSISPDWLYNALMGGKFNADPNLTAFERGDIDAMYGNYVKSQFRNMTLGLARITPMDRMVMSRMAAIQRELTERQQAIGQFNVRANILRDPLAMQELKDRLQANAKDDTYEMIAETYELQKRLGALSTFYGYQIAQKSKPMGDSWLDDIKNLFSPSKQPVLTEDDAVFQNALKNQSLNLQPGRAKKEMLLKLKGIDDDLKIGEKP